MIIIIPKNRPMNTFIFRYQHTVVFNYNQETKFYIYLEKDNIYMYIYIYIYIILYICGECCDDVHPQV